MYEVIGMQHRQYKSKRTGNDVSGWNVAFTYEEKGYEGLACMSVWLSDAIVKEADLSVGDNCTLLYNRWGSVESVRVVD